MTVPLPPPTRTVAADLDPHRYPVAFTEVTGARLAYVQVNPGGAGPLLLVHGWPETKRLYWKVIGPLAAAGFEVIAPDLRGFGDSEPGADGRGDVASHSADLRALVVDHLGHQRVVAVGGDLGGAVVQDLALRHPELVARMVLTNSPLPYLRGAMDGLATRPAIETSDYFVRQGTDADELAAELATPEARERYVATFYTSRLWASPGAFTTAEDGLGWGTGRHRISTEVDFHTEPFAPAPSFRASLETYTSVYDPDRRLDEPRMGRNPAVEALILHGVDDRVIYPDFDAMAAVVFPRHVGPFRLRRCGHFVPWEAPGPFTSAVRTFCRDLLPG